MPFVIDQNLCSACGSCVGNCPNRAIIQQADRYRITTMCCDCGLCRKYCSTGAIGTGPSRAELDNAVLNKALREKLSLQKRIAAMKLADAVPAGVAVEKGPQFWCGICGDIFDGNGEPVYFEASASSCGGSRNIGIGSGRATKEEFDTVIYAQVVGEGMLFATKNLLAKNRDQFPRYPNVYAGMVLGDFDKLSRPDMILFPVNGRQLCMISTAFAFDTGEVIHGYAGKSTCLMTVTAPFVENRPVFTAGDHGGRMFMRLDDSEMLVCIPFRLVPGLVCNLDRTVYAGGDA